MRKRVWNWRTLVHAQTGLLTALVKLASAAASRGLFEMTAIREGVGRGRRPLRGQGEREFESLTLRRRRKSQHALAFGEAVNQTARGQLNLAGCVSLQPSLDRRMIKRRAARADRQQHAGLTVACVFAVNPKKALGFRRFLDRIETPDSFRADLDGGCRWRDFQCGAEARYKQEE